MSYSRLFIYTSTCIVSWLSVFVVIALLAGTMNFFPDLDFQAWCILFGAYALSVLAGFVAIFAPGGIFVREAAFCVLVSSILEYEYAIQLALVIRLWAVAYDIFFGVIGLLLVNSRLDLKVE